ncbi:phosphotransferase family protein [Sphingomonas sp. SUN019]|uniref:phosphotransferase family protein n=1 Tax=Sphingomonas sp. SUN019 TaxID=2937788 RepID=UPI002164C365|nr:phosphotransferase family protein [Sphingomonas sp. SUN019]UVO51890.1 phosphotransferase family protein [Sphingomonas sp. SUN019]
MAEKLSGHELGERLTALAPRMATGATRIEGLTRLTGGASMETWSFDASSDAGAATPLILRRRTAPIDTHPGKKPPLRLEAEVIAAAVANGVAAPDVAYICDDADGLDEAYVMRRVAGETLGKRIATDPAFAPAREKLAHQCGAALARIHATAPVAGLGTVDARETLANYEETWRAAGPVRPTIEAAFRWLERRVPEQTDLTLVHGDFRNGNIMVDPDAGLAAVLDWELAHIGDPAEDLGWICTNSWRFGQPRKRVGGFGDLGDLLAGYVEAGGAPIARDRVDFWQMVGSLKWGVMTTMMHASFAADPAAGPERGVIGRRLSETEADIVAIIERSAG